MFHATLGFRAPEATRDVGKSVVSVKLLDLALLAEPSVALRCLLMVPGADICGAMSLSTCRETLRPSRHGNMALFTWESPLAAE